MNDDAESGMWKRTGSGMSVAALIVRLLLAVILSVVMLLLLVLAGYYIGWFFFGLTGHPSAPDAPVSAYWAYAGFALLVSVVVGFRVAFYRSNRDKRAAR